MARQQTTLSKEKVETLASGEKLGDLNEAEDAAFEVARALHITRGPLSDEVFNRYAQAVGKD